MAVKWCGATKGDRALDLCCGSGDLALLLAEYVGPTGQVVGLDFAKEQLEVAQARQKASFEAKDRDIRWVQGDALSLPFADASFDAATMGYALRNVLDIPKSLRETCRVLRPGASAAFLDFNNGTGPIASFQGWFLDNVVVPVARNYGAEKEYQYLRPSIERFPRGSELEKMALAAGFDKATYYDIAAGLMGCLVVTKGS
eukprot:jgi/Mesvir1/9262/Mv03127-RA.1